MERADEEVPLPSDPGPTASLHRSCVDGSPLFVYVDTRVLDGMRLLGEGVASEGLCSGVWVVKSV